MSHCFKCGRNLTVPESIAAGIGPICKLRRDANDSLFEKEQAHIVEGEFTGDIILKRRNGTPVVNIEQHIVSHSPTGFEWGYCGSGPADLALNILIRYTDKKTAHLLHQQFKSEFIAGMPEAGGIIKGDDIMEWILQHPTVNEK